MSNPVTPLTPAQVALNESQAAHEGYVRRNLIALDDLGDTILDGKNDETMSCANATRWCDSRWCQVARC